MDGKNNFLIYLKRDFIQDVIYDITGSIFYSVSIYTFASNAGFAPGGVSGAALILHHYLNIPIGTLTILINIPMILISFRYLGLSFLLKSVKSMILFSVVVDYIFPHFPQYDGNQILAAIFCGAFGGIGLSFFYRRGSSSGGTDFLTLTLKRLKPHWSIGSIMLFLDSVVIFSGAFVFGQIDAVLYGVLCTAVGSTILDKMMESLNAGQAMVIISQKEKQIEEKIRKVLKVQGIRRNESAHILFLGCNKAAVSKVCYLVYESDPDATTWVWNYSAAYGKGLSTGKLEDFTNPYNERAH